ncbi:MAG: cation diffusion facilitator family transporter [Rhodospirillales bacterium]
MTDGGGADTAAAGDGGTSPQPPPPQTPPTPPPPPVDAAYAHRLKRRAAIAAVAVAATLIAAKAAAWIGSGSVAVLSTLVDSVLDLMASLLNLVAIRQAAVPADREHRFGHGKAEPIAGLGQAAFIGGSAAFLLFQAGERLLHPRPIENSAIGLAVMVFSIVLTLGLVAFQKWVIRRVDSVAIDADSLHYTSDLLVNGGVIVALLLTAKLGWQQADAAVAAAIGLYILFSAAQIVRASLNLLMDHELPADDRARIREIVAADPGVINMHDLRTRSSGTRSFIQLHLELDPELPLREAHAIADRVMARIEVAFPNAEVLIHEDPYGIAERRAAFE